MPINNGEQEADESGQLPCLCYPLHRGFDVLQPYVEPKYHAYLEPVVGRASPYVNKGKNAYSAYVHPRVLVVSDSISRRVEPYNEKVKQWHTDNVQPFLDRAHEKHDVYVAPYVKKSGEISTHLYNEYVVPGAQRVYPHIIYVSGVVEARVVPYIYKAGSKSMDFTSKYGHKAWDWITGNISPKIVEVYHDTIEPQIIKIQSRVNQIDSQISSDNAVSTTTIADETTSSSPSYSTTVEEPVSTTSSKSTSATSTATARSESVSEELIRWREIVKETTNDAFNTFLDDVEMEKQNRMQKVKPEFEDLVEKLETVESAAYAELSSLVSQLNDTVIEGNKYTGTRNDKEVTPGVVQDKFREHAEQIRQAAFAVRTRAESFADELLKEIEKLRTNTVEVLDEFGEVSLQEIGRKLVSLDSEASTTSSTGGGGSAPNWKDWKEYRNLKDILLKSRQEIVDFDVNMADINLMLRQAQERANSLAKESAQILSGLRANADILFQERLQQINEEKSEAGKPLDDEVPENAEIYEEEEEEEEEDFSTKKTGGVSSEVDEDDADDYDDYIPKHRQSGNEEEDDEEEAPPPLTDDESEDDDDEEEEEEEYIESITLTEVETSLPTSSDVSETVNSVDAGKATTKHAGRDEL